MSIKRSLEFSHERLESGGIIRKCSVSAFYAP
jgi:hypothetical protein